jgi:hypothetical protein
MQDDIRGKKQKRQDNHENVNGPTRAESRLQRGIKGRNGRGRRVA